MTTAKTAEKTKEVRTDTKKAKAVAIVLKHNADKSTKWLVSELMEKCALSQLGARTYVYNIRKEHNLASPPREVKGPPAAKKKATTKAKETATATPRKRPSSKKKTDTKAPADENQKAANADAINE